jgi:hypothetical protein
MRGLSKFFGSGSLADLKLVALRGDTMSFEGGNRLG